MPLRALITNLLPVVGVLLAFAGCAPERIIITDADDLARFAAASGPAAEKRIAEKKAAENKDIDRSKHFNSAATPSEPAPKPKLDAQSQAFLDRITREDQLAAAEVAAFEELLTSLPQEQRAIWIAQTEASDHQNRRTASPPQELPPQVKAEPISRRAAEIQQADYHEPISDREIEIKSEPPRQGSRVNTLSFANRDLLSEVRSVVQDEFEKQRAELKQEQDAERLRQEEAAQVDRQQSMMLEAIRGHGARNTFATDDDLGGSLASAGSGLGSAELAAALMKSNSRLNEKKTPPKSEPTAKEPPKPLASSSAPLSDQKLDQLWNQIAGEDAGDPSLSLAMRRKIFLLAAGSIDAASAPPEEFTPAEKEWWKHIVRSLEMGVKLGDHPRRDRQAALVSRELREAVAELESASVLDLQNAAFCSSVQAFGNYVEFESTGFKPNDEVILYVELQNFASRQRVDGKAFETEFQGTYQILDSAGKRVADQDLPIEHGVCRQRRRDYFLAYRIHVPKNVSEGAYTLQLTLEDKISGKFGQTSLKFTVQK